MGYSYPYTSPDLVTEQNGKSNTKENINDIIFKYNKYFNI